MATALPPPCDEVADRAPSATAGEANGPGTLAATVAGSSLAFVVGSIVNVALPAMQREFGTDAGGAQWIVNAYLLPLGALVLIGGALGDHYGRRRMFLIGLAVFGAACLACALAPSLPLLLAARALLGVAAALVAPNSLSIIADAFSGTARAKAVGTWAAAGAIAGAVAPVAGGWIVDQASWRWAFGAVVPFAALALLIAQRTVRESVAAGSERAPLDWLGAGLAAAGLFALIWALIAFPGSADGTLPLAVGAAGLAVLAAFVWVEHRKGDRAMTPPDLFTTPTFTGISLLTFFLYASLGGLLVVLPYVLIEAFDYGATAAGAALLPFPLVMGVLSRWLGGSVAERIGTRTILTAGSLGVAAGFVLLSRLPAEAPSYWRDILPGLTVLAVGMAASVAPLTNAVLASAGDARGGRGVGSQQRDRAHRRAGRHRALGTGAGRGRGDVGELRHRGAGGCGRRGGGRTLRAAAGTPLSRGRRQAA